MFVTNEGSNSCCGRPEGECSCEKAPKYFGQGAGQIIPPVQNKAAEVDDNKPAGGALGVPVWNFAASPTSKTPRQFAVAGSADNDQLPAGGALGQPAWNF